jgi:predicted aspartyl protease
MSSPYNTSSTPPIPALMVTLRSVSGEAFTPPNSAFVDTGADATLVPESLLDPLQSGEIYIARLRSHWGEWRSVKVYLVDLEIKDLIYPAVEVIADETGSAILLGRNFLNRLILLLDGPHQQTDILPRRPHKM